MAGEVAKELEAAIEAVLKSKSRKKLVVAGPGTGKTTLFKKLLEQTPGTREQKLVLTFINNLRNDLDRSLGKLAHVSTLHGYCQSLLHREANLRAGLTARFVCYPELASLIQQDWEWTHEEDAPTFVKFMRDLNLGAEHEVFYMERGNYYDAVDFDDSVYRTYSGLTEHKDTTPLYELVLVDEFQDFNGMEAAVIDLLADKNPIAIAGDDDQALYSVLRSASWDHIRERYKGGGYEIFQLPFCMRCPEVIVGAASDVLLAALKLKKLIGRIEKPYKYYEPKKGDDSRRFPKIDYVTTTVQRTNANYFARFIEKFIREIAKEDHDEAASSFEPTVLIIASNPYRSQIVAHLLDCGLLKLFAEEQEEGRGFALKLLKENRQSNLAWRIVLAQERKSVARAAVCRAIDGSCPLIDAIPVDLREQILKEAAEYGREEARNEQCDNIEEVGFPQAKVTSYEGAKGLSAQYVFLVGLHEGELPRNAASPEDIEICRFLVGLTRTKKKCTIMVTKRFGQFFKNPSVFLRWIDAKRLEHVRVDATSFEDED